MLFSLFFFSFASAQSTRKGKATHYGPWEIAYKSEVGYQPLDVGVGCSNGQPGGDPRWNEILEDGQHERLPHPANVATVWPKQPTVAVSAAMYGKEACFQKIVIENKATGKSLEASIVDFCPAKVWFFFDFAGMQLERSRTRQ